MDLSNRYKIKGISKEQVINSVVNTHTNSAGKITMVEDRWNHQLPEGTFAKASWAKSFLSGGGFIMHLRGRFGYGVLYGGHGRGW
jgi:hypothetical protein